MKIEIELTQKQYDFIWEGWKKYLSTFPKTNMTFNNFCLWNLNDGINDLLKS